ncbi:bacteriohemerythrin, partial [Pseudodesulfovibrio sp.]|uniref:bacteriohemerythrin n=1 Tax=Pseudodesulfovibrio sp. TaxID=2035812 RepID=UPI003427920D
ILRISLLIALLVAACIGYYLYRADTIAADLRAQHAATLASHVSLRLGKERDTATPALIAGSGAASRDFRAEGINYALLLAPGEAAKYPALSGKADYDDLTPADGSGFSDDVREALSSLDVASLVKSGSLLGARYFAVAVPQKDASGQLIGYHVLAEPRSVIEESIDAATSTALHFIITMAAGFCLLGGFVLFMLNRTLLRPMRKLAEFAHAVSEGDMEREFTTETRYELKTLADTIMRMIGGMRERTAEAQEQARQAHAKSLEAEQALKKASAGEEHVSKLLSALQGASSKAEDISHQALEAVNELSREVDLVARGVEVQRDRMMETATAMEEMNSTVAEVARNASRAAVNASASHEKATTGAEGVRSAVASIGQIETRILDLKETMHQLDEQASSIGKVLGVITEIADQTNLLALNAAIEAARAGEAGRGFAVVADEVRKLAEKTMDATKEVEKVIVSIQEAARENVRAVESAAEDITRSTEASNEAGRFMEEIVSIVEETAGQVDSIATASEEQSATSEEINRAVSDVNRIAAESAEGMRRSAENLASITALVSELDATVQKMASGEGDEGGGQLMVWSDKLSVGIHSIDEQHKKLVKMINSLNEAMKSRKSQSALTDIVKGLEEYVAVHFGYEEKLFDKLNYPDTLSHKAIHRKFVDEVVKFRKELAAGRATVSMDIMRFLKDWLVQHIMGTDAQYGPFMKEHNVR